MPKTCSRCGPEKPLHDFYKQAGGAQGRRGMCKECFRAAERASYARQDTKGKKQMPPQCGQCGGSMELLEEGDNYLLAQCLLCQTKYLDPPRRARHVYLADEPSQDGRRCTSRGLLMHEGKNASGPPATCNQRRR
jgi:hypothetical protein